MPRKTRSGPTKRKGERPIREAAEPERQVEREEPGRTEHERGGERAQERAPRHPEHQEP